MHAGCPPEANSVPAGLSGQVDCKPERLAKKSFPFLMPCREAAAIAAMRAPLLVPEHLCVSASGFGNLAKHAHSQLVDSAFILGSYLGSNAVPQSPLHVLQILVDKFCRKTSCANFYLKHVRFMACLANEPVHPCASVASSSKIFV